MVKIEFDNNVLYKAFKIEWALPEKAIDDYVSPNFYQEATQEEIDKQFKYDLEEYLRHQEQAWGSYLSFTDAIEKVIVRKDKTIFVISDNKRLLKAILNCINGYGEFYFSSVNELIKTTDRTAIKTIKSHFFWLKYYSEIYGKPSISRIMESYLNG